MVSQAAVFKSLLLILVLSFISGCNQQDPMTTPKSTEVIIEQERVEVEPDDSLVNIKMSDEQQDVISQFRAMGNEPFWTVEVDGMNLRYITPEYLEGIDWIADQRTAYAKGVVLSGTYEGQRFELDINSKVCEDSMSGEQFEFSSVLTLDNQSHTGCASRMED